MNETGKPRHIRDIAHIYLSRLENTRPLAHDRLVVCGESRKTLPAFHIAALSAAFALKRSAAHAPLTVTVFDVSGVLPNVGYYFSVPSRTCLMRNRGESSGLVTALLGIKLGFSWGPAEHEGTAQSSSGLEFHHIPPFEDRKNFQHALARLRRAPLGNTVFLFITRHGEQEREMRDAVASNLGEYPVYTLGVERGRREFAADQLGAVSAWESSAADRIPAVCRDPQSTLARRYQSLCEVLIYKIQENRRKCRGANTGGPRFNAVQSNNR